MARLIGTDSNQAPTVADLGSAAFLDKASIMGPAFCVKMTSDKTINDSQWAALGFEEAEYNIGNGFDLSTDRFTAFQSGIYLFNAIYLAVNTNGINRAILDFTVNGVQGNRRVADIDYDGITGRPTDACTYGGSRPISLKVGDYVQVSVFLDGVSGTTTISTSQTFFAGQFIRPNT